MRRLLSVLLLLSLPGLAISATLSATPATLGQALARLRPGDTLVLRAGTYPAIRYNTHTLPSGTSWADAPRIIGAPGETVRVAGLGLREVRWLIFANLVIDCADQTREGVYISTGAHHIRVQDSEIKNCTAQGVLVPKESGGFNEFLRLDVHHNGTRERYDHGFYISAANNIIADSRIHHNAAYGVHVYSQQQYTAHHNRVIGNEIYANGARPGTSYGILAASGYGTVVSHNRVHGNKGGISVAYNVKDAIVCQNTITDNAGYGLMVHNDATGTRLVANRVNGNGTALRDDSRSTQAQAEASGDPCPAAPSGPDAPGSPFGPGLPLAPTLTPPPTDLRVRPSP